MSEAAKKIELPVEIADELTAAGYEPNKWRQIFVDLKSAKARIAELERVDVVALTPLKALLPDLSWYEPARRAAEAGRLRATKLRGRFWYSTPEDVAAWLPTTRRWQRERMRKN